MAKHVLYDHPRSGGDKEKPKSAEEKKPEKAPEKKPDEPRNEKGQTQGEERDDVSDKSPMGEESNADPMGEHMDMLKSMLASHESERRDLNNNHREERRQMHTRHEKGIKDHMAKLKDMGQMAPETDSGGADEGAAEG